MLRHFFVITIILTCLSIAQGKDTDIKDLIKQAEESYSNYDYKNAIHYLDKALEINPTHFPKE